MKVITLWLSTVVLVCATGCVPKPRPSQRVVIRVESDPGVPLARARVQRAQERVGESDADGSIGATLSGTAGDSIALTVTCPEGYRSPAEPLTVLLRSLDDKGRLPEFQVACPPLARRIVIAVRAHAGPNLPLRYLGQEIARTDAFGAAHALLVAAPGDVLSVSLDTSGPANSALQPQNPELKLTAPDRDELFVFDQSFTRPKPKPRPRKPPEPEGPQRI